MNWGVGFHANELNWLNRGHVYKEIVFMEPRSDWVDTAIILLCQNISKIKDKQNSELKVKQARVRSKSYAIGGREIEPEGEFGIFHVSGPKFAIK